MLKKRLIPVLLLQNGLLVRSELFKIHQIIGNPIIEVQRFNEWNVDELIYLDITCEGAYDLRREDHKIKNLSEPLAILNAVSETCFMPLTWGGRIRTLEDMRVRFANGADKIAINTIAFDRPSIITEAARAFGSQAVVVSMDAKRVQDNRLEIYVAGGRRATGLRPSEWARQVESFGAGEILLQSIDHDGTGEGYDVDLIAEVASSVRIPVIACSGVGQFEHYADGIHAGASAAAAANIWHFKDLADRQGKRAMARAGIEVRQNPESGR
ncbi:MAG: imidazole glycerol phosphate synthase cyclase subunit [Lentisphaerae bacterium GWF2_57_35]|nr:MAG: imidazole glycerol phosphate synthase cyclase subunit [Lentisphaerae bacterium GWF2_57_35]